MIRQTLIPVNAESESSFTSFQVGENPELLAELQNIARGARARRVLYFYGPSGSGKTHLLHACCEQAQRIGKPYAYLPLDGTAPTHAQLSRMEKIAPNCLLCIDDFQFSVSENDSAPAQSKALQVALLQLYEKIPQQGGAMVIAADRAISQLNLHLKDLASRLVSGGVYPLAPLSETDKLAALRARARQKGFELNDQLLQFILTYYRRDTVSLFALLERIDSQSLAEKRKITVPFIKSLL